MLFAFAVFSIISLAVYFMLPNNRGKLALLESLKKEQSTQEETQKPDSVFPLSFADIPAISVDTGKYGSVMISKFGKISYWDQLPQHAKTEDADGARSVAVGDWHYAILKYNGIVSAQGSNFFGQCDTNSWRNIQSIDAGAFHTVGVTKEGLIVAAGQNTFGQCNTEGITDAVAVATGERHTVILKKDGTVTAIGHNYHGQCDVEDWSEIIAISAGPTHTVGLKENGEVVCAGSNSLGECETDDWSNIISIDAGAGITVGVTKDGKLLTTSNSFDGKISNRLTGISYAAAGYGNYMAFDAGGKMVPYKYIEGNTKKWSNISAVSGWHRHLVALMEDGTVSALGENTYGQCEVFDWTDIIQIYASTNYTLGLKSNGTVVATGYNKGGQCDVEEWTDIIQISAGQWHSVGLRADGTVVATGDNHYGQCDVEEWTDIVKIDANRALGTFGLKSDGTVVYTGIDSSEAENWTDIVDIYCDNSSIFGFTSDGEFVYDTPQYMTNIVEYVAEGEKIYTKNGKMFIQYNGNTFIDPENGFQALTFSSSLHDGSVPLFYWSNSDRNILIKQDGNIHAFNGKFIYEQADIGLLK